MKKNMFYAAALKQFSSKTLNIIKGHLMQNATCRNNCYQLNTTDNVSTSDDDWVYSTLGFYVSSLLN